MILPSSTMPMSSPFKARRNHADKFARALVGVSVVMLMGQPDAKGTEWRAAFGDRSSTRTEREATRDLGPGAPENIEMVTWKDDLIPNPAPASDEAVRRAERALRVRFPADFLAVARARQGAAPVPNGITLPDGSVTGVHHLLHFAEEPAMRNIVARRFPVEGVLPKGVIPFAEDIGGDLFCFNHRKNPRRAHRGLLECGHRSGAVGGELHRVRRAPARVGRPDIAGA